MSSFRCASCGAINRLREIPSGKKPVCGKCKERLELSAKPQAVDAKGLARALDKSPVPVLVDFWAEWCGPCRMAAPILERIASQLAGKVIVLKLDTDAEQTAAARHGVQSLPTFSVFSGGDEVARKSGLMPEATFRRWVEEQLERAA